jgi:predicted AAA+ superfamily ATPase
MQIERTLVEKIKNDLIQKKKSILLLGPRQTGKSSLLKLLTPDLTLNFAKESVYQDHLKDPSLLEKMALPLIEENDQSIVFIDEIQRIPGLMNTVQALIDDHRNLFFIISGSSARKLRKTEINLLPGRVFSYQLHPLTYWELGENFNLMKCLSRGSLPEIYLEDYGPELLDEYISTYLREEIIAEALVRNISNFSHFLDVTALSSWNELNYSQLASDAEIPKETIRRYMDILSETLIIHRIPGFHKNLSARKAVQKEKYLFFDIGVRNSVAGEVSAQKTSTELGNLFEQWIVLQIHSYKSYFKKKWDLYYYRDDQKIEVDLIIETHTQIYAIEIKWGEKMRSDWLNPLIHFSNLNHKKPVTSLLLYRGSLKLKDKNVLVLPYNVFFDKIETYFNDLSF